MRRKKSLLKDLVFFHYHIISLRLRHLSILDCQFTLWGSTSRIVTSVLKLSIHIVFLWTRGVALIEYRLRYVRSLTTASPFIFGETH